MLRNPWILKVALFGAGLAVAIVAHGSKTTLPAAQVRGEALSTTSSTAKTRESPAPHPASRGNGEALRGDALLRGDITLDKAVLRKDRYEVPLYDGSKAILTLDPALQKAAEAVLVRAKAPVGAIVVMAPDGRILALAGRRNEPKTIEHAWDAALSVWAPAASIFKLVTASALVADGVDPKAKVCYHGGLRSVDATNLEDNPSRDNECADLALGVAKSQNAVLAKLTHKHLDKDELAATAAAFGFDTAPTFALDVEANRFELPDAPLEFARVASGFWSTELSPLGGALVANVIATGGMRVTPRIVEEIAAADGSVRKVVSVPAERAITEKTADAVAEMMVAACELGSARKGFRDERGRRVLPEDLEVAGKTGSLSRTDPSYLAYSWFVGFAPADRPKVAISVLLGNGEKWHLKASTAARMVLDELF